jgi:hypothetical protein
MSMCVVEGRPGTHARALVNAATAPPVKRMDSRRDRAKPCAAASLSTSPLHSASLCDCWTGRLHGRERCAHRGQAHLGVVWQASSLACNAIAFESLPGPFGRDAKSSRLQFLD